ncbi:hypothetical protein J6590_024302 [Homalodisca vitripennis]|nr:hypothetical protein J6590_024302 [Homalodisca vitripennis]
MCRYFLDGEIKAVSPTSWIKIEYFPKEPLNAGVDFESLCFLKSCGFSAAFKSPRDNKTNWHLNRRPLPPSHVQPGLPVITVDTRGLGPHGTGTAGPRADRGRIGRTLGGSRRRA